MNSRPSSRLYRQIAAVDRERGTILIFPLREARPATLPDISLRAAPWPGRPIACPPSASPEASDGRPGHSSSVDLLRAPTSPRPPHVGPFQRRQPDLRVLIDASVDQPLDPARRETLQWQQRPRDGWDNVGVALAITAMIWIAARCLPAIFPFWFN